MRLPRLLIPAVVFVTALGLAAFTFLRSDDTPIIDTSGIDTPATAPIDAPEADSSAADSPTSGAPVADDRPSPEWMDPIRVTDQAMGIGDPDAPMVMVTFESFGCLWCGNFHRLTMPEVYEQYVDTGLLRIEARMMPYEERGLPGALIGIAAGMQDRYWELADLLYPFISGDGAPPTDRELSAAEVGDYRERQTEAALLAQVEGFADRIGLDYEQFLTDYRSVEAQQRVSTDTEIGYAVGFTGTPAMVVNGVPLGGWVSFESMDEFLTSVLDATTAE